MRLGALTTATLILTMGSSVVGAVPTNDGDALVSASIGEPSSLVPILASDSASAGICGLVFSGLIKYDKDLQLIGDLAERWDVLDGGLTILFHLRHDVRWHDGQPFTADDVQFTYQQLINPNVRTPYSGDFERVKSLEVVDPYTVKVTYGEPFAPGLASWGMWIMPKHLLYGQDLHATSFARHPIGTGPYRFRRWVTADRVELEANPDYHFGKPHIAWWVDRIIPDQSTIFLELQTEGVDLTDLTPLQYARQTETTAFRAHYQRFRYPSPGFAYLGYNLKLPMFSDVRVRQAINLAIDKEELVQGALFGLGRPATGPFRERSWAINPEVKPTPVNSIEAQHLLDAAGWRDSDHDGWRDKDGHPFAFTLVTNKNLTRELAAQIIQRRLKEIGIKMEIRVMEWSSLLHNFIDKRQFEVILLAWSLSQDPDVYDIWHSSKTREGEFNFVGYANPMVDKLLEEARRTFDQEARAKCYHEIHRILYEEQPYCFLYVADALPVVHTRVRGITVAPAGIDYNLQEWYVPRAEHRYDF